MQRRQKPATGAGAELLAALEPYLVTTAGTGKLQPLQHPDDAPQNPEKPAPSKGPPSGSFAAATERIHFYRLERSAAAVLVRAGGLESFVAPLPEDLCVLASDKTPWLQSEARAGRYRLQLTAEEHKAIAKALPWLQLAAG